MEMKINWKIRFKNKTWLLSFLTTMVVFAYQILGMFGIVPAVSEDMIIQLISVIMNMLIALGVVIDPTTPTINDDEDKLNYINQ